MKGVARETALFADKSLGVWRTAELTELPFLTT
jgi:hypothetical protein